MRAEGAPRRESDGQQVACKRGRPSKQLFRGASGPGLAALPVDHVLALVDQPALVQRHKRLRHGVAQLGLQRELFARPCEGGPEERRASAYAAYAARRIESCTRAHSHTTRRAFESGP